MFDDSTAHDCKHALFFYTNVGLRFVDDLPNTVPTGSAARRARVRSGIRRRRAFRWPWFEPFIVASTGRGRRPREAANIPSEPSTFWLKTIRVCKVDHYSTRHLPFSDLTGIVNHAPGSRVSDAIWNLHGNLKSKRAWACLPKQPGSQDEYPSVYCGYCG